LRLSLDWLRFLHTLRRRPDPTVCIWYLAQEIFPPLVVWVKKRRRVHDFAWVSPFAGCRVIARGLQQFLRAGRARLDAPLPTPVCLGLANLVRVNTPPLFKLRWVLAALALFCRLHRRVFRGFSGQRR